MSRVPFFSILDFHSTVFSSLYKSPVEWDPKKKRLVLTPSIRSTPLWTIITLGFEICLAQVGSSYLLITEFCWPQSSTMASFQVLFQSNYSHN